MAFSDLLERIKTKRIKVGVIGLGYVGLPLAIEFAKKGMYVVGFDIDPQKAKLLLNGKSYIKHIKADRIQEAVNAGLLDATSDFSRLPEVDAVLICVPTPLDEHREPDVSFIVNSGKEISKYLRKEQIVVLESSTYPGTTDEILRPMFENAPLTQKGSDVKSGSAKTERWIVGKDFYLAFSPEREDPNNPDFSTSTIPKVVGGCTPHCLALTKALYDLVIVKTVPVSSTQAAEATKLLENIYRSVNIALVNELKMVFDRMGLDVWEIIEAAKTKPFGFNAFYPGPGLGGHCIPIDPFYLTWKAREYEINTKFIELAGEINTYQPYYVVQRTIEFLNEYKKSICGSKILILGAAYKKDIDDMRESPTLKLIEIFKGKGAKVDYNDPYIPVLPPTRKYNFEMKSVKLTEKNLAKYDVIVISTNHSEYDYSFILKHSRLIVDTRNAMRNVKKNSKKVLTA